MTDNEEDFTPITLLKSAVAALKEVLGSKPVDDDEVVGLMSDIKISRSGVEADLRAIKEKGLPDRYKLLAADLADVETRMNKCVIPSSASRKFRALKM
jgi:hypothetical protein